MNIRGLLGLGLLFVSAGVFGQTACPSGVPVGSARCGPGGGNGLWSPMPPSQPHWELTWGAIAADSTGAAGWAVGHLYKWAAKRKALSHCREMGGKDCKVMLAYEHQCAAIANPTENGKRIAGSVTYQSEGTLELASERALSACKVKRDGGECSIAYAECSVPVLMK